ncbi:MAG: lysylphosphatidylglycerol synthase transmembrane domain-containing protein [Thermodesulfobacteriota bacterium]
MVSSGPRCVSRLDEAARGIYNRPDRISGLGPQTAKGLVACNSESRSPSKPLSLSHQTDREPNQGGSRADRRWFWGTVIGYSVVAIFAVLCGHYIYSHREDFAFVATVSYLDLAIAGVFVLASFFLGIFQMGLFLKNFGVSLGFMELAAITMTTYLGNLVLPMRGGTAGAAIYLKRAHGLNFGDFAVIYAGTGLLMALVNTGLALAGLIVLYVVNGFFHLALTVLVLLFFAFCSYLSVFPPSASWKRGGFLGRLFELANSWHVLTRDRPLLLRLTVLFVLAPLFLSGSFHFVYRALGIDLAPSAVLVTSSLGNVANLVPIIPGSLGVFDAVTIQIPHMFGLDAAKSISATLLYRVILFLECIVFGIPGVIYLFSVLKRAKPVVGSRDPGSI